MQQKSCRDYVTLQGTIMRETRSFEATHGQLAN